MSNSRSVVVITTDEGQIIGAMRRTDPDESGMSAGLAPLPGHSIQELEIPEEIAALEPEDQVLKMLEYRVHPGSRRLERTLPADGPSE